MRLLTSTDYLNKDEFGGLIVMMLHVITSEIALFAPILHTSSRWPCAVSRKRFSRRDTGGAIRGRSYYLETLVMHLEDFLLNKDGPELLLRFNVP